MQILQHLYTRCQEELEKNIEDGGKQLLVKLLRTEDGGIRKNLLGHFLKPKNIVVNPDGREIDLGGGGRAKVELAEFQQALAKTVEDIRNLQEEETIDNVAAVNLVESTRQVAIDARLVIEEEYGVGSKELGDFEQFLQPIFRPV